MKTHKTIVLPDIHVPNHDTPSLKAIFQFLKFYKPDRLIQLGDLCDWDSVTTYDPRRESDIVCIEDEVKAVNSFLDELESHLPKSCEKVLIGGNHEERFTKFKTKFGNEIGMRRMRKLTSWWDEYRLPDRRWSWCQYGEWRQYGKIVYTHGWYIGKGCAAKHLNLYHKNIIFGHTHIFDVATAVGLDGNPVMGASIGTLSKTNLSYLIGKPPVNWIHMFATVETLPNGQFTPNFIPIIDGKFISNGRVFG